MSDNGATPPTGEDWLILLNDLRLAARVQRSVPQGDNLPEGLHSGPRAVNHAFVSVLEFLRKRPEVVQEGLDGPLIRLCAALADLERGHPPPLLQPHKRGNVASTRGAVPLQKVFVLTVAACALDALVAAGEPLPAAASAVARAVTGAGHEISTRRGAPLASAIKKWRQALMTGQGVADALALRAWSRYRSNPKAFGETPSDRARSFLKMIKTDEALHFLE